MMQQHARQMQEQELRRSQERQSRPTERKTIVPIRSSMSEQTRERQVKQERHESQREEIKTVSSMSTRSRKQTMEKEKEKEKGKEINIPVKNYRSQSVRAREPSPPVDYPDVSDDTDENDVRLPDMDNNKKARKKSIQSYSKRTSVTRQYPGCVLS